MKEEKIIKEVRRANILKRSYFFNKIFVRVGSGLVNLRPKKIRKAINILKKKNALVKNKQKAKILNKAIATVDRVVILMRPNNTFISLSNKANVKYLITAGLAGFAGPKRSSPYSRHVVARIMSRYISRLHRNNNNESMIDIYFNSRITRRFYFLFKGLISRRYDVRYIARNKMVAHGYIRRKKKRRK